MTNIRSLLLIRREKSSPLSFSRLKIGCIKMVRMKQRSGVYIAKLEELKKRGDPIEVRFKEHSERGAVIDQLVSCINSYREAAMSNHPKFDHIEVTEKQKVLNECVEAEAWLREKQQQHESLTKHSTPAILSANVRKKS